MRCFFLLLLLPRLAVADAGLSYLGLCSPAWNCKATIKSFQNVDTIYTGWLENTFAKGCSCGDRLLRQEKPVVLRVHLTNSPCLRNRRCGSYEVFAGETVKSASRKIVKRNSRLLTKYRRVIKRFKRRLDNATAPISCYVSPCLECDLSGAARRLLHNYTARLLPDCALVDSVYRRRCLKNTICEKHGSTPSFNDDNCIGDLDGEDGRVTNLAVFKDYTKQCLFRHYWEPMYNCIRRGYFVDPRKRDCKYSSREIIKRGGVLCHLSFNQSCDTL